jgi:hypothetical protein
MVYLAGVFAVFGPLDIMRQRDLVVRANLGQKRARWLFTGLGAQQMNDRDVIWCKIMNVISMNKAEQTSLS